MKTLTLWQPWASLVAIGVKTIETRSWQTNYRGPLLIHAAAKYPDVSFSAGEWSVRRRVDSAISELRLCFMPENTHPFGGSYDLPIAAIVATCTLIDVLPIVGMANATQRDAIVCEGGPLRRNPIVGEAIDIEDQRPFGDFRPGRFAWLLSDIVKRDEPIPCSGRQGLWNFDVEQAAIS